jgi:type IV pilus assembly protein PilV
MKNLQQGCKAASQRGSTLVEAVVAVLLLSIGVIGLMRALGTAVQDTGAIQYRATAATLADSLIGRMWVDRANLAAYVVADEAVAELPNGTRTVTVNGNVVTVQINWQAPEAEVASNHQVTATIVGN